jgi:multicomponent K+:H+ antiporter subunit F
MSITEILYYFGWAAFIPGLAVSMYRIAKGPTMLDRMLGLDLLTITSVALMIVYSIHHRTRNFMELILIVTALGFFTTVAFFYYLSHLPSTYEGLTARKEDES